MNRFTPVVAGLLLSESYVIFSYAHISPSIGKARQSGGLYKAS